MAAIQEVTGLQITSYLRWLRNEYKTYYNKPLADKTIKHHYNILRIAFNCAEKHDLIINNPMKKVDAPIAPSAENRFLSLYS